MSKPKGQGTPGITTFNDLERALRQGGFVLVRTKGHRVWRGPDGQTVSVPYSSGDKRALNNLLSHLRQRGIRVGV